MSTPSLFDIMGPIMIGPSSSHTAGAARLGKMAYKLVGGDIREAKMYLHGSSPPPTGATELTKPCWQGF